MTNPSPFRPDYLHRLLTFSLSFSPRNLRWLSAARPESPPQLSTTHHLQTLFGVGTRHLEEDDYDRELALVSALKSCASQCAHFQGRQIHSLVVKSGLDSNSYIQNSLINMYAKSGSMLDAKSMFDSCSNLDPVSCNIMIAGYVKCGSLSNAHQVFAKMPNRGCVSYTTMIMGFAQNGYRREAVEVFKDMVSAGVVPNEVTMASVVPAWSQLGGIWNCRMLHGLVIKLLLDVFVVVSTNLLHMYCICSSLGDAQSLFEEMPERNTVSWNVMLNGYSKSGLVNQAKQLFDEIPAKDVVSWGTMIDGYVQVHKLREALIMCQEMLRSGNSPNDVMLVDLVSACGRSMAVEEGRQLHSFIVRNGFDCYDCMQATIIHFYAVCGRIDLAWLQFEIGFKNHLASLNALIAGFARNGMINRARELFDEMSERDVFSWTAMISGYAQHEQPRTALELFHNMISTGARPNEITMISVFSAIASLGSLQEGQQAYDYVMNNSIRVTDNLSASIIDMYAKCGSIGSSLEFFYRIRDGVSGVSPWNAIICGLAMHGHANLSLELFNDLQEQTIKLNSITFVGVLTACCHSGLVDEGERYFKTMKEVHGVEPDVKHYGCMVDMLGRAGWVREAEELIKTMPMEADVVVWGALMSACRTHGDVEVAERAARRMAALEPSHGPCRVLLSNIYADAGKWKEAFSERTTLVTQRMERSPGYSGVAWR